MSHVKFFFTTIFFACLFSVSMLYAEKNTSEEINKKNIQIGESKMIIGATEYIKIEPPAVVLKARIDTGAKTTSIDARDITPFERDGKKWVKFSVYDGKQEYKVERPVFNTVLIKRHGDESQRRYLIKMRVTVAEISQLIPVSLTDRSRYEFPILIGRNFLKDYFIVDVSKNNILNTLHKNEK